MKPGNRRCPPRLVPIPAAEPWLRDEGIRFGAPGSWGTGDGGEAFLK